MGNGKRACVMAVPNPNKVCQQFLIESEAEMRFSGILDCRNALLRVLKPYGLVEMWI